MKVAIIVLVVACAVVSGKHHNKKGGPRHPLRQSDSPLYPRLQPKVCPPYYEEYHKCMAETKERVSKFNEERKNNLTKKLDSCFIENGCTPLPKPDSKPESNAEQECKSQFHRAKKEKVRACVKSEFPEYVFAPDNNQQQQPSSDLHLEDIEAKVDHCANKDRILECRRNNVAQYRKANFQAKCSLRARCLVLMPERCQDRLEKIKFKKCNCKAEVRKQRGEIRKSIAACQQVPPKPHQHHQHGCPRRGYCKAGFEIWLVDHPLQSQLAPPQGPPPPGPPPPGPGPVPAAPNAPGAPPLASLPPQPGQGSQGPPQPASPGAPQAGQPAFQLGPQPLPPQAVQG